MMATAVLTLRRLGLAITWTRALYLASKKRHADALRLIESLPSRETQGVDWKLLKLQQLRELKQHSNTVTMAQSLISEIEVATNVSEGDRSYLAAYAKWLGRSSFEELHKPFQRPTMPKTFEADWKQVILSKVSSHHKKNFPLRPHPDWPEQP